MKMISKLVLFLIAFPALLRAQEVLISDEGLKEPFQGRISYTISYTGENLSSIKGYLPDSVDVWFSNEYIRSTYYGGLSDSLMKDVLWSRNQDRTWTLDHKNKKALYIPFDSAKTQRAQPRKSGNQVKISDILCQKYTLKDGKYSHSFWVADSLLYPFKSSDTALSRLPVFLHAKLKGLPLRYHSSSKLGTTKLEAKTVLPGSNPQAKGKLPDGYQEEEFKEFVIRTPLLQKD